MISALMALHNSPREVHSLQEHHADLAKAPSSKPEPTKAPAS